MVITQRNFSKREQQIVGALLDAKAVKDIALELDLSVNTVKDYLKAIYRKAQVHSARELMVRLTPAPPPTPDTGLAVLLQTAQSLADAPAPADALRQLAAAVRRCTPARTVSFWRLLRGPGELLLAGDSGQGLLHAGDFVHRVLERGWARLEPVEGAATLETRQLAGCGLSGELIGVQCNLGARVHVLLAGDPVEGRFGVLDVATIRLLVRLSTSAPLQRPLALRASA
ncbi:MAG: LuxR C-terminal-related transcriptional regulator [Terriglobales bacterium]